MTNKEYLQIQLLGVQNMLEMVQEHPIMGFALLQKEQLLLEAIKASNNDEIKSEGYFKYIDEVITDDLRQRYMIVCANINHNDKWVWKFCNNEYNFCPIWSAQDCTITIYDLESTMDSANKWVAERCKQIPTLEVELFLMKI